MSSEPEVGVGAVALIAKDIIKDALASNTLWKWTIRAVRLEVAMRLGIDESVILSSRELKDAIKAATDQAQVEYQEEHPEDQEDEIVPEEHPPKPEPEPVKKVKKAKKVEEPKAKARKRKSDAVPSSSSPPPKKRTKESTKKKTYRSTSIVHSSDEETAAPPSKKKAKEAGTKRTYRSSSVVPSSNEEGPPPPEKKTKDCGKKKAYRSSSIVRSPDEADSPQKPSESSKSCVPTKSKVPKSKSRITSEDEAAASAFDREEAEAEAEIEKEEAELERAEAEKSESEMSILIDDERPKRNKKATDKEPAKRGRKKKEPIEEDKDDKEIKRLKQLVSASGHRKPYTKLFSALSDPTSKRAQIKLIKDILIKECGFPKEGRRWTVKLAKELKEKREFEKELEDVKQFEKAITSRSSRTSRSVTARRGSPEGNGMDEDESDEDVEVPPKNNARKRIMAFLEDQSEESD